MLIRLITLAAAALALSACASMGSEDIDCDGLPCVAIGEALESGGATITPLRVVEDSRCPVDAECFWEGRLRVAALVQQGGREREVELTLGSATPALSGNVQFTKALPEMRAQTPEIPAKAYRFNFTYAAHLLDAPR